MVVEYNAASEGSSLSFFVTTPQIILTYHGSIVPKVLPQVLMSVGLASLARWWNPVRESAEGVQSGMSSFILLMSILMVFKTQSAYAQFWEALTEAHRLLETSRHIAMTACTVFLSKDENDGDDPREVEDIAIGLRVVAARQLSHGRQGPGSTPAPYAIVTAGDMSFKTEVACGGIDAVWDSGLFRFSLDKREPMVTLVVRDAAARAGRDLLGWTRLTAKDVRPLADGRRHRPRYRLQGEGFRELELEVQATRRGIVSQVHDGGLTVKASLRKVIRFLALYFFVVAEYFRRTGANAVKSKEDHDLLRNQIKRLTGEREYAMLYPGDERETSGSQAKNRHANPTLVLYWLQLTISRSAMVHHLEPALLAAFAPQVEELGQSFWAMDRIDKHQFPLPYAQVVKLLLIVFTLVMIPWALQPRCGDLAELIVGILALCFFSLDEVAEILESPFGKDPNHIDLWAYGDELLHDLEMMYRALVQQGDHFSAEVGSEKALFEETFAGNRVSTQCMELVLNQGKL